VTYQYREIFCPFPVQHSPHVEHAREHVNAWVRQHRLVSKESAWRRFVRADFAWFAAATYPSADAVDTSLVADWFAWLFLVDDQLDDGIVGRDPDQARAAMQRLLAILDATARRSERHSTTPAVAGLADLWERTSVSASREWRRRFTQHVAACFSAAGWEADNRVRGVVPDEQTYTAKRRHTGAIYVCMDLIEVVERIELPVTAFTDPTFQTALDLACNVVCWTNDVYSLEKEQARGEYHNLVAVVAHQRQLTTQGALDHVIEAISQETRRFMDLEKELLGGPPWHRYDVARYLAGMRSWMRGNLDWSRRTKRYHDLESAPARQPGDYLEPLVQPVTPR
jgi:hypothetical protein